RRAWNILGGTGRVFWQSSEVNHAPQEAPGAILAFRAELLVCPDRQETAPPRSRRAGGVAALSRADGPAPGSGPATAAPVGAVGTSWRSAGNCGNRARHRP